jgi:Na+/H+ antiporter NhaA
VIALAYPRQRPTSSARPIVPAVPRAADGDLARSARSELEAARLAERAAAALWHPWTSYVIVPLFALANAGIASSGLLGAAFTSPVTLGILFGYVVGKPIGIVGATGSRRG